MVKKRKQPIKAKRPIKKVKKVANKEKAAQDGGRRCRSGGRAPVLLRNHQRRQTALTAKSYFRGIKIG